MLCLQGNLGIHIVTNIGPTIKSSVPTNTLLTGLNVTCEAADSRIILHAKDMVMNGATNKIIHTVDSYVLIIAISYYFSLEQLGLKELWGSFGTGKHHSYIAAHDLAHHLGEERAEAMRGYHAFTDDLDEEPGSSYQRFCSPTSICASALSESKERIVAETERMIDSDDSDKDPTYNQDPGFLIQPEDLFGEQ
ncbi:unnamed protein product [Parnassius apollo]|uniref:(apollo) hypothetical protein n=1 Tax=Parnassius apollo TaxID=110799 RepID=A0A8S3WHJ6_PARAO|nr:unnamed protein product [Parnassius apollo]